MGLLRWSWWWPRQWHLDGRSGPASVKEVMSLRDCDQLVIDLSRAARRRWVGLRGGLGKGRARSCLGVRKPFHLSLVDHTQLVLVSIGGGCNITTT